MFDGWFYILIIVIIIYRFIFFSMLPEALGSPYWINMGAITAAARLPAIRLRYPIYTKPSPSEKLNIRFNVDINIAERK